MQDYYWYLFAIVIVMILGAIAQYRVRSVFAKYSQVDSGCGRTASQIASALLAANGSSVRVACIQGSLTDNYNPRTGQVSLSQTVYSSTSISAIAVAAHECGHVMQYEQGYTPIIMRNKILPIANIGARFSYLLVILGLIMGGLGYYVSLAGVALFAFAFVFQLITLPVELDASNRALDMLSAGGYIVSAEHESAARKVLRAAAFTYFVAVLSSAVTLLRLLSIVNSGRRN